MNFFLIQRAVFLQKLEHAYLPRFSTDRGKSCCSWKVKAQQKRQLLLLLLHRSTPTNNIEVHTLILTSDPCDLAYF